MSERVPIDSLRPHPAHERVPMASGDDLANLRRSLAENGQQDPIDATPDGLILDGRTRWSLLRGQGAREVEVRVRDIPEAQQVAWIVDRAVARRHLSMAQKRDLNDWLRSLVVEVRHSPKTGEEQRIGMSAPQRAETLGVEPITVKRWDEASGQSVSDVTDWQPPADTPTHVVRTGGKPYPIHPSPRAPKPEAGRRRRPAGRDASFAYMAALTHWVRKALPEQRSHLLRIKGEVERALALIDGERKAS